MSKIYTIKSNEKLFNEWMRVSASPHSKLNGYTWSIVQNDMKLSGSDLNEWFVNTGELIDETEEHFKQVIAEMRKMRLRTVNYIKLEND